MNSQIKIMKKVKVKVNTLSQESGKQLMMNFKLQKTKLMKINKLVKKMKMKLKKAKKILLNKKRNNLIMKVNKCLIVINKINMFILV